MHDPMKFLNFSDFIFLLCEVHNYTYIVRLTMTVVSDSSVYFKTLTTQVSPAPQLLAYSEKETLMGKRNF